MRLNTILLSATLLLCWSSPSSAERSYDPAPVRGRVGAKIGLIWQASLWRDSDRQLAESGSSGGVFFDLPVGRKGFASVELDLHDLQAFGQGNKWLHVMLVGKRVFSQKKTNVDLRPFAGAGIGYFAAFEDFLIPTDSTPDTVETIIVRLPSTTSFVVKAGLEVAFRHSARTTWLFEFALMAAPFDIDNPKYRVRYGPTLLIRGGIML